MRILYAGPLWQGSTSLQRLQALARIDGVEAIGHDSMARVGKPKALLGGGLTVFWYRVRWKLRIPVDQHGENRALIRAAREARPDALIVDSSRVVNCATLRELRRIGVARLAYYSPDDIVARHNLSFPLKRTLRHWDVVFTTKTFNVPELHALKVARPILIGKAYDAELHTPAAAAEVGSDHERYDAVFVGTYEHERCASINALADAGISVVVYGSDQGNWTGKPLHPAVELRPAVYGGEYRLAWHTGKVALCFLRKINRDQITQRTMEIASMGRPMAAEKTEEHDQHFVDGEEYFGFSSDAELVSAVRALVGDPQRRMMAGKALRARCLSSGYSTVDRARAMVSALQSP